MATRPVPFCAAATASAPASESASGISTCTCLPAFRQAIDCSACICVGVHRITASTSFSARLSARSVPTWAMPYLAATSFVLSSSRPITDTTSTPSMFLMPSRCLTPNAPAPASATLTFFVLIGKPPCFALRCIRPGRGPACSCRVLQDQMADGGVARRHVIEAMRDRRLRGAGRRVARDVGHRASRDEPHHELDPLGAGLAHVVDVRQARQALGVGDQAVEKAVVPLLVDEAGTRPLQLVAHAAGAPDLHL